MNRLSTGIELLNIVMTARGPGKEGATEAVQGKGTFSQNRADIAGLQLRHCRKEFSSP